jgi:Rap1a immunity proteins
VVTVAAATGVSPAQAVSGRDLLRQCEAVERGATVSGETVQLPKSQDAAACWFYMGAVQDLAATVEEEGGPSLIGSCVRPETTRMELVRAFTRYARTRRADLDLRATALIIPALNNAFPCPMPSRTEAGPPRAG